MSAPKQLKDLPGFDDAMAEAIDRKGHYPCYDFDNVGNVVIPGLQRVVDWYQVCQLAMACFDAKNDERRCLRVVPPARLAANDCKVSR